MLRWFHALMPKEERFFDLFQQHAETVLAGAKALRALLDGGDETQTHYRTVLQEEKKADDITREVLISLRRSFITPFDRGNIRDLISSMDNSIDQMHKTAKGIALFEVRSFTPQMQAMGDTVVQAAGLLCDAIPLLKQIDKQAARIAGITRQISELEGRADDLHDAGLKELYLQKGKTDAMAFIVGNEIYDHLEKVVDRFDDVANEIHGIVLEYV